ncbi:N,N-dimethylformamidase beta subunit family domain-containing protein [Lewinella sp. IMCC34191]|uniref:N,N-dimethylformamidase beta subunit family domain-containing protein n=1 Tax=Lewinella sp. IMCC34191 TaxID=2259172 RepID=UPI000E236BBF|nr:N,N-dimethylformamidase beta subunit family domain-containing protein [Lewinella sp. IMCC34191]
MLKTSRRIVKWVAIVIGCIAFIYVVLLIPRYEKYRKSNVSFDLDLPAITAFAYPNAYVSGDTVQLYVHAEEAYEGKVYRVGDGDFELVGRFSGEARLQSEGYDLKYGHDWEVSHVIPTADWEGGFYVVQLTRGGEEQVTYSVPVLLRDREGEDVLVVEPTNTWQAYNEYGGKSNYRDRVTPRDLRALFDLLEKNAPGLVPYHYLPTRRPLNHPLAYAPLTDSVAYLNGKMSSGFYLIKYLEELGVPYGVISDTEFAKLADGKPPKLVLFDNHSEYWSYEGMGRLKNLLENGTNVAFLSGNNMYREIEVTDHGSLIVLEQQSPRSAVEPLLGTYYSESGYQTYGSFRVTEADHWVFDSTGLGNGDSFGDGVISGLETDKLGPYSEGFTLLAIGTNAAGPAHMVVKEFPEGNFLFNTSSISSVRAIPRDSAWRRVIVNLIERGVE